WSLPLRFFTSSSCLSPRGGAARHPTRFRLRPAAALLDSWSCRSRLACAAGRFRTTRLPA
ncbi:hypothetical protein P7K49_009288, partial [Saguinus oedipus]